jgi:TRAP-type C4-dicarboxylate transport system permease small subunit
VATYVCGGCSLAIMAMMVLDATLRTFFNIALRGLVAISEILMVWVTLAALAHALIQGTHVRVTLVLHRLPPRFQAVCEFLTYLIGFVAFGFITYYGWFYFWRAWLVRETAMTGIRSPIWAAKPAIPFAAFLFSIECFLKLMGIIFRGRLEVAQTQEQET